jgi:hypothetical protein
MCNVFLHGLVTAVVGASVLLTMSYFVIWSIRKGDGSKLSVFGYITAAFLWVAAALSLVGGLFVPQGIPRIGPGGLPGPPPLFACDKAGVGSDAPMGWEGGSKTVAERRLDTNPRFIREPGERLAPESDHEEFEKEKSGH